MSSTATLTPRVGYLSVWRVQRLQNQDPEGEPISLCVWVSWCGHQDLNRHRRGVFRRRRALRDLDDDIHGAANRAQSRVQELLGCSANRIHIGFLHKAHLKYHSGAPSGEKRRVHQHSERCRVGHAEPEDRPPLDCPDLSWRRI